MPQTFNKFEALLWTAFALGFLLKAILSKDTRILPAILAILFFLFGLSDLVEVRTGAWYRPWWLFVWKALCVISLVSISYLYWKSTLPKANASED